MKQQLLNLYKPPLTITSTVASLRFPLKELGPLVPGDQFQAGTKGLSWGVWRWQVTKHQNGGPEDFIGILQGF